MGSRSVVGRRILTGVASVAILVGISGPATAGTSAPPPPPLLGGVLGQGGLLGGVLGTINGILGQLVDTGWRWDKSVTTMDDVRASVNDTVAAKLYTGRGVGVALVDTGVVPVKGLTRGNVVNGPDLSFESQSPDLQYLDTFGHGTHMAGIIAGDSTGQPGVRFVGMAPNAKLTSIKVAASDGAVDVSQVIAAIDWVVEHRNDDPQNPIRVLNLSYGTDGTQDYRLDPLTDAVENAWRAGIVVVVSAGNGGTDAPSLNDPAYDPDVIAVGAADTNGTARQGDDIVSDFSSRGNAQRRPDLVAPGRSIASLRDPGSYIDTAYPDAKIGEQFRGSGSSQAAAVVSGAVAQLLDQRPGLTPDQVKKILVNTATPLSKPDPGAGAGELNLAAAFLAATPSARQTSAPATGLGSLEAARGTQHVADDDVELDGENSVLGPWSSTAWAAASASGTAWVGGTWMGQAFAGDCWCGTSWTGQTWAGRSWAGTSWAGRSWAGRSWAGRSWAGTSWAGSSWAGRSWAGRSWAGLSWG